MNPIKEDISAADLYRMLSLPEEQIAELVSTSHRTKEEYVGNIVYLRGLIEFSNICSKNCYYCGIRCGNSKIHRYTMEEKEVTEAALYAHQKGMGSIVIQAGERSDKAFIKSIESLLKAIMKKTNSGLRVTLSLGEQSRDIFRLWKECGADRYLLRIEDSSEELYKKIHPDDSNHSYSKRLRAIEDLKAEGYQVGSGFMIGLPFQTIDHLVNNLLFLRRYDIDMVGMGPYIENDDTPLYRYRHLLLPGNNRLDLTIKVVAALRIMAKDINIAATTAMQTLADNGRERAIVAGANVIMPNLTPLKYRKNYHLYKDKPLLMEDTEDNLLELERRIESTGNVVGYNLFGDSKHFLNKDKA